MYTLKGFNAQLANLLALIEPTQMDAVEEILTAIRADYEQVINTLTDLSEPFDAESDTFDFVAKEVENEYKEKYLDLKEKYVERFMGTDNTEEDNKEEDNTEGENPDNVTLEDLFTEKEDS